MKPKNIGNMYLLPSESAQKPITNVAALKCWGNSNVQGVAARTKWVRCEPSRGVYYWTFLDQIAAQAKLHGKKFSILITAGEDTPPWLFTEGAYQFKITNEANKPAVIPLPTDPVFQTEWARFVAAFGMRYGGNANLAYVVMGGPGRRAESYFVTNPVDQKNLDTEAVKLGFKDGMALWLAGVKWIINQYGSAFSIVPFILDLGSPAPTSQGNDTLLAACDYGSFRYPGRFGVKSDGLGSGAGMPPQGSLGVTEVKKLSPTSLVGYQETLPQGAGLYEALRKAIVDYTAHFVEIYSEDCDSTTSIAALQNAIRLWGI